MIKARDSQSRDLEALETKAGGLIYFYSSAAYTATRMDIERTLEASSCLGFIGLIFLDADFDDQALSAVKCLTSLAKYGSNKLEGVSAGMLVETPSSLFDPYFAS